MQNEIKLTRELTDLGQVLKNTNADVHSIMMSTLEVLKEKHFLSSNLDEKCLLTLFDCKSVKESIRKIQPITKTK
jgi:hypothetical protein